MISKKHAVQISYQKSKFWKKMTFFTQITSKKHLRVSEININKNMKKNILVCFHINRYVYRDECLEPFLISFIKKYHKDDTYVFWPDQASAHYAKEVQDYLNTKDIPFEPRNLNPQSTKLN